MPESKEQKAKKEEKEAIKKLKNEAASDKIEVPLDIIDSLKS